MTSSLQMAAVRSLGLAEWWVSPPGHINYLTFDSVEAMMRDVDDAFPSTWRISNGTMALARFDYILFSGSDYHESASRSSDRANRSPQSLYEAFGAAGLGRTLLIVGRRA